MKYLLILLFSCVGIFGAAGDITGVAVETNGWQALVFINGMATNGTFAFGFANTNNIITGSEKLKITLTSPGYDDTGSTTTVSRVVYGLASVRNPTPNDLFPDTVISGSNVKLRIALSDYIYQNDVINNAVIGSGLYVTNSITSASAIVTTVTNSSLESYPKCIANWTYPGNQIISGSTMRLRAAGFQRFAQQGQPIRVMKFIAKGATSGTTVSGLVTRMTIDRTLSDSLLTGEYIYDVDISGMTQGELIRCDFIAYPWIGDSISTMDTTLNTYAWPTPYPCAYTNRCNRTGAFQSAIAVVKATGSDVNGRASTLTDPTAVSSSIYFATLAKAANQCAATNNISFGHNDLEGSIIYVYGDINTFAGASSTYGNAPNTWSLVTNYPSETVAFSVQSGDKNFGTTSMLKFQNVSFTGGHSLFSCHTWMDHCTINTADTALNQTWKSWYITDCTVPQLAQGFSPNASTPAVNLLRGNDLTGFNAAILSMVIIGNKHPTSSGPAYNISFDNSGSRQADGAILYNNDLRGSFGAGVTALVAGLNAPYTNGLAILQNVFEDCGSDSTFSYAPFGSSSFNATNILLWNNVFLGGKLNFVYNDLGTNVAWRTEVSVQGNLFDDFNIKSDTFPPTSVNRIGNWSDIYSVGWRNNVFAETSGTGAAGQFTPEALGLCTIGVATNVTSTVPTNTVGYLRYVNRKAWATGESNPTAGGGDYRTLSDAPSLKLDKLWILPFDLEGNNRGEMDPPGAFASAQPRKGGFFF